MSGESGKPRDRETVERAQRKALRAFEKLGTWRKVGQAWGVNHGNVVALVKHGKVPQSVELRTALGLPKVMPSERKPRVKKVMPMLGSPCWMCMAFKEVRPGKKRRAVSGWRRAKRSG